MNEQEKTEMYLKKLQSYFKDIPTVMKHLEVAITPVEKKSNDGEIKDPTLMGIKVMCGTLYLCLHYLNQISIMATPEEFRTLARTMETLYKKYRPEIVKCQSEITNQSLKDFKDKELHLVKGNTTMQ
jgi:hypothetical protein